jgi:hypothetical protein
MIDSRTPNQRRKSGQLISSLEKLEFSASKKGDVTHQNRDIVK